MFLKRSQSVGDDAGSSMIAVIGLVAVAALVATTVTTSTVQALNYTSATRAGMQAQAAADAGVQYLASRLGASPCESPATRTYGQMYTSEVLAAEAAALGEASLTLADLGVTSSAPYFEAKLRYRSLDPDSGWQATCPPSGPQPGEPYAGPAEFEVEITSTGWAAAGGSGGVSGMDRQTVQAVFPWRILTREEAAPPPPTQITASGPAVYAYSSEGFGGSGTLVSVNGSQPGVVIKEGTVTCNGASAGIVDIVAGDGDITVNGSCNVDGNVWASGRATIDGGTGVKGSVIANGVVASRPIGGSIWSTGDVKLTWGNTVGGTVTARNLEATGATIEKNVVATGDMLATQSTFGAGINAVGAITLRDLGLSGKVVGRTLSLNGGVTVRGDADIYGRAEATDGWASQVRNLTAASINFTGGNRVTGTRTIRAASSVPPGALTQNPATPARPAVPGWIDFDYDTSDWTGFTEAVMSGGCTVTDLRTALARVTGPALVNALGCTSGISIGGSDKVALNRDVAIFANKFDLNGSGWFSSADAARLWLIQPDTVPAQNGRPATPDCGNRSFSLGGGFGFDAPVSTMIYSPCRVDLSSSTVLTGHIYAGKVSIGGAGQLKYVRVGLPGIDLDNGDDGSTAPPPPQDPTTVFDRTELGDVIDYRDVPE